MFSSSITVKATSHRLDRLLRKITERSPENKKRKRKEKERATACEALSPERCGRAKKRRAKSARVKVTPRRNHKEFTRGGGRLFPGLRRGNVPLQATFTERLDPPVTTNRDTKRCACEATRSRQAS